MIGCTARWGAGLLLVLCGVPRPAAADVAGAERRIQDVAQDVANLAREANVRLSEDRARYVEEKLADADMFFRLGFYEEAGVMYLDIVENYPEQTAYADALFHLGESLYKAEDPFGAREFLERLLQQSTETRFRPYIQPALGRLIEIAIRMEDFAGIERYFAELNRLPGADVAAVTPYFRGKYHFHSGNLAEAERAFLSVPDGAEYTLRARYFLGAVYVKLGDLDRALQAFESVLRSPAESAEDRATVDLANLAIGRIQYEQQGEEAAIEAYQRISTDSEAFDDALYEVSWVHLARGDTTKARRSLEMLVIYDPESRYAPEAKLLLGNILLREGRLVLNEECFLLSSERLAAQANGTASEALPELPAECTAEGQGTASAGTNFSIEAFRSVKLDYGPVYDQIAGAMSSREQLRDYFGEMVRSEAEAVTATNLLPPQARAWFVENESISRVQQVLDGLAAIRRYVTETERLAAQLQAILSGRSVVGAFSELRGVRDRTEMAGNSCARIRASLAGELNGIAAAAGEAAAAREERRSLDALVARLPEDAESLSSAYETQRNAIDLVSHALTETNHTVELVHSMGAALDQYLIQPDNWGNLSETEIQAIQSELQLVRGAVDHYRNQAADLRRQVDVLRAQVQVGEVSAEAARDIRVRHRQAVAREASALAMSGAGGAALSRVQSALDQLARVEADLATVQQNLEGQAQDRGRELLAAVEQERGKLEGYRSRLAAIEDTASEVVGGYAFENFEEIAGRFEDLILRSDIGVADSAWSLAEEHRSRMIQMGQQRDRDLQSIQMEYDDLVGN
ncbi:MAG: tetratricopeptide repeat protein [Deltaproteobacteria bacterium]|nr:tetratricopeptide repeat protein [Deltaproteobacteria bacterium]